MFHCGTYETPMRILNEEEIMNLSGLGEYWNNTCITDAEKLLESFARNMCGNSFHPALISSALGNSAILTAWINGEREGSPAMAANQHQTHAVYAELCQLIKQEGSRKYKNKDVKVVTELLPYPQVERNLKVKNLPKIAEPVITGYQTAQVSKKERKMEHCVDAALDVLDERTCALFKQNGLEQYFDSLRAPIQAAFTYEEYTRLT